MSLIERISDDVKQAMRDRNALARDTLRMVQAELKNRRIELQRDLTEEDALQILARCVKTRQDSVEQYEKASRPELAAKERDEIAVIEGYLPEKMSEDDARAAVQAAITESGAASMKDMGLVMKALMAKHKGLIDGKTAQVLVKELLGS
ncbi:MAG: hypothetical protein ACI9F9_001041 [Candidatus Paceibacteria bacterium]|jgi:uncharacterized protein YqeY